MLTSEEEREMLEFACDGARNGFASYFESDRSLDEPEASGAAAGSGIYGDCVAFLNSPRFLEFVSTITGIANLEACRGARHAIPRRALPALQQRHLVGRPHRQASSELRAQLSRISGARSGAVCWRCGVTKVIRSKA